MIAHINLDDRLSILRANDPSRSWNSLDDQRVCVLCGRKFKGRQVDIRRVPGGKFKLCCPTLGCTTTPQQWRYIKSPVVSGSETKHWRRVLSHKRHDRYSNPSTLRMQTCRV
jgi:hypothetical protein